MTKKVRPIILVFGCSGLLGWHCYDFLRHKYHVIGTYKNNYLPNENSIKFNALDGIISIEKLLQCYKPDIIINALAFVTVDGCEKNPELATRLNVTFVRDLVTAMKRNGLSSSHLIQISSDSVYGQCKSGVNVPWSENDPVNPMSFYALTKLKSERESLNHQGNLSILRTAFYGVNPNSKKSLLSWIIDNAVNGREMDGWENVYFSPVSAFQLVSVINSLIEKSISGIYNVSSIDACNKFDFVDAVCKKMGLTPKINRVPYNQSNKQNIRPEYSALSSDKLSKVISWNNQWRYDLEEYLEKNKSLLLGK
jgi:dTDP-4-dehydrorhamnose reductase